MSTFIPRSQLGRTMRVGLLSSKVSLRQIWARLRAALAPPERRPEIVDASHLRSAEEVLAVMGDMKGAVMKLAQIASFISDDVPEQYRTEPWHTQGPYTFTPEYNAQSLARVFDRNHPRWGALLRQLNMPADFAIVDRLQWGCSSILARLGATANWRAIVDEYLGDEECR
jgi:hypothetical protein